MVAQDLKVSGKVETKPAIYISLATGVAAAAAVVAVVVLRVNID